MEREITIALRLIVGSDQDVSLPTLTPKVTYHFEEEEPLKGTVSWLNYHSYTLSHLEEHFEKDLEGWWVATRSLLRDAFERECAKGVNRALKEMSEEEWDWSDERYDTREEYEDGDE